jgi:hypothetical protein
VVHICSHTCVRYECEKNVLVVEYLQTWPPKTVGLRCSVVTLAESV